MAMKIIFMGTPNFAVPVLKAIHESEHEILEVYTQPAAKSGRGQKLNQSENLLRYLFIKVKEHQELPTKLNYEKK